MKTKIFKIIVALILTGCIASGCERRYYEGEGHERREHRHYYRDRDDNYHHDDHDNH